jgi:hypothetical protein
MIFLFLAGSPRLLIESIFQALIPPSVTLLVFQLLPLLPTGLTLAITV